MEKEARVGVSDIVLGQTANEFFLHFRGSNARNTRNAWSLPGGGVDYRETRMTAMVREMKEELGIIVTEAIELFVQDEIFEDDADGHWVCSVFLVEDYEGEARNMEPDKFDAHGFFSLDNLPEPLGKFSRAILQRYVSIANGDGDDDYTKFSAKRNKALC